VGICDLVWKCAGVKRSDTFRDERGMDSGMKRGMSAISAAETRAIAVAHCRRWSRHSTHVTSPGYARLPVADLAALDARDHLANP
jgi:hypothetical protein